MRDRQSWPRHTARRVRSSWRRLGRSPAWLRVETTLAQVAAAAVARASRAGAHRLWCLADNHRARGLYDHLGWRPTGLTRTAEWPPYPIEIEYADE